MEDSAPGKLKCTEKDRQPDQPFDKEEEKPHEAQALEPFFQIELLLFLGLHT